MPRVGRRHLDRPWMIDIAHTSEHGCCVLAISGDLGQDETVPLLLALRQALLDSSQPVLCHLGGVGEFSQDALDVFPLALAEAGGWPEASLALVEASPSLVAALGTRGIARRVQVFSDVGAALPYARFAWRPAVVVRACDLTFGGLAAAEARAEVRQFCDVVGCDHGARQDAMLVASELATNGVLHGQPPLGLTLTAEQDVLEISVQDGSPVPALAGSPQDEHGRGLGIVAALALTWSSETVPGDGKVVTAEVRLRPEVRHLPSARSEPQ